MVNTQYIECKIKESGKKKTFLADKLGISRQALDHKIKGDYEFKGSEVILLCEEIGIPFSPETKQIFFA